MAASSTHRVLGILSSEVTPNEEFYTVSKNFIDPDVRLSQWSLAIDGLVDKPTVLEFDEIRAMPSVEKYVTLECISNEIGGDLISNALWRGVPLKTILEQAQIAPESQDVALWASDGYTESISIDKLMQDEVLVVYEMNGQPLPRSHGFPVRLIVPGYFGLKSVKWLTRIEPVDINFTGYWQGRGWTDVPIVKTMSRIDTPAPSARLPLAPLEVGGIAFAGTRGIQSVEIRTEETGWTPVERISTPARRIHVGDLDDHDRAPGSRPHQAPRSRNRRRGQRADGGADGNDTDRRLRPPQHRPRDREAERCPASATGPSDPRQALDGLAALNYWPVGLFSRPMGSDPPAYGKVELPGLDAGERLFHHIVHRKRLLQPGRAGGRASSLRTLGHKQAAAVLVRLDRDLVCADLLCRVDDLLLVRADERPEHGMVATASTAARLCSVCEATWPRLSPCHHRQRAGLIGRCARPCASSGAGTGSPWTWAARSR